MTERHSVKDWKEEAIDDKAWASGARHGTVVIETTDKETIAILVDDSGTRGQYRLSVDAVPTFLATATKAWSKQNGANSLAVIWGTRGKGVVAPPPPPPPPGPIGDDVLLASTYMGHHQLLAVGQLVIAGARSRSDR